jgi:LPS-assembly protein
VQTLEPRLLYAYIPYRDQSQLPVFDSAVADFNFTQLFRANRFSGNDRVSEANQLTAALVGRVIDPATGAERLRGAIGQRFYFSSDRVTLPGVAARSSSESDLLAEVQGTIARGRSPESPVLLPDMAQRKWRAGRVAGGHLAGIGG